MQLVPIWVWLWVRLINKQKAMAQNDEDATKDWLEGILAINFIIILFLNRAN